MTDASGRFALPFILPGQAQKEAFHNEALIAIDCPLHPCAESADAIDPPDDPQPGQSWIIGEEATGAWAEQAGRLVTWTTGGWRFTAPVPGMMIWNKTLTYWMHWTGETWANEHFAGFRPRNRWRPSRWISSAGYSNPFWGNDN